MKYATQIFSHTVAAGICTYSSVGSLAPSALGIAELLSRFDSLFDCVNSSNLQSTKKLRSVITEKSSHIAFLQESINQINGIKVLSVNQDVTSRIKPMKGWLVTLNAIISIWNKLKTLHNFQFLFTRRLNTNPLENFFRTIRKHGGIVTIQLQYSLPGHLESCFFSYSSLLNSSTGNCAEDRDTLLAIFSTKSVKQSKQSLLSYSNPRPNTLSIGPTDYREPNVSTSIIQANAIAHVSGYLLKKCFKIHSCAKCNEALTSANLEDNRKLLCLFKSYSQEGFGGLRWSNSE